MKTVRLLHRSVNIDGDRFSAGKLENVRLRLHGHIVATIKGRPTKVQFFTDLINELTSKNKKKIPAETISFLMSSMRDLVDGRDGRKISCRHEGKATRVRTLQKTDIQCWSDFMRQRKSKGKDINPVDAICIADRALSLCRTWDLTLVQMLAIMLGLRQ